jgi:hypothetical protein
LRSNGDAEWTVSTTFNLTTQNETAAYRELASEFENGETSALGLPAFRRASSLASESTGREMVVRDVTNRTAPESMVENGTGRLTNFGRVDGNRLLVGDAFRTEEGLWLDGLEPDQTLVVRPPEGFGVVNATVAPTNRSLVWEGPESFGSSSLSATCTGNTGPPPSTPTPTPNGPDDPDSGGGLLWMGLFLLGIGALVAVGYFVVQTDVDFPSRSRDDSVTTETDSGSETDTGAVTASAGTASDTDTADAADEDDGIDVELLSDEERVERLLEQNGGRMKQANIVKETGWSNAKVSQLLSAMQDEGRIDKLRIGRENLISFPDEDITDIEE